MCIPDLICANKLINLKPKLEADMQFLGTRETETLLTGKSFLVSF